MSDPHRLRVVVPETGAGMRIDRYVAECLELFPRSQIPHRELSVRVGGANAKLSRRLRAGDELEIEYTEPESSAFEPENIPLDIIFENDDVVVLNKPAGMVVHPAAGNWTGTLVQGLMYHIRTLQDRFEDRSRPGIVHRLDKDTSGVIIAAKHPQALSELARQFHDRTTEKHYLAIVKGQLRTSTGTVDAAITRDPHNRKRFAVTEQGGKRAVTGFRVVRHHGDYSLVSLRPQTGRTHQLRVHMMHIGCPIVGDPIYARRDAYLAEFGLLLHAYQLKIRLPGECEPRLFTARLPESFRKAMRAVLKRP